MMNAVEHAQSLVGARWRTLEMMKFQNGASDGRRLEVVADGLPLFGGAQLAIDTTLVSTLHANGLPRRAGVDGAALQAARRRKEWRYPELARRVGRARLVVLAVEVCGRWSKETQSFLSSLAHAKARSETSLMRRRVLWWVSLFSCTVARAVATSLLELPPEAQMAIVRPLMRWNVTSGMQA